MNELPMGAQGFDKAEATMQALVKALVATYKFKMVR